jgi:outer membrane protein OmpA-like peptidoglycan-associated protein
MMGSRLRRTVLGTTLGCAVGLLGACATDPSEQLMDARQAYTQAYQSEANQLVPDRVYEARIALEAAERQHERKAGSDEEKHLAYIAHRKALLAMAEGDQRDYEQRLQEAQREREDVLLSQRDDIRAQLDEEQQQLEGERVATAEQLEEMERRRQEEMREFEETRQQEMQELRDAMGAAARVEEGENEEVTITLDGMVLFQTGESDLLPPARNRLETVAQALEQHASDKSITIEGHTDSTGSRELNRRLSKERAESVKGYLVRQGIDPERIETVGKGPDEPLVPNDTPSNRAMNRRVEIVVGSGNGGGSGR